MPRRASTHPPLLVASFFDAAAPHGELVATLGMTKGAVSKIASSLEIKGLVARVPHPQDARSESLNLTAAGRALVPKLAALADANDENFFGHLAPQDRAHLRRILEAIAHARGIAATPVD
jgi:DNA-binding MarR family transcriptional regulator